VQKQGEGANLSFYEHLGVDGLHLSSGSIKAPWSPLIYTFQTPQSRYKGIVWRFTTIVEQKYAYAKTA
jgi:hypothetical protein